MFIISCAVTFVNKNRNPFFESELHKFVDEEVLPRARQDTAGRYVNSATCVAEFIHGSSSVKRKIRHTRMSMPYFCKILALHKFVDEEVLLCGRSRRCMCRFVAIFTLLLRITPDTARRYVNSATFVAGLIHAPSLPKEKYGTLE